MVRSFFILVGPDGTLKIVNKIPMTPNSNSVGKSALTSLLTSNSTPLSGNKTLIGTRRIYMTKGADGTSRVITTPTSILPKAGGTPGVQSTSSPSIIKVQTPGGTTVQTIQVQNQSQGKKKNGVRDSKISLRISLIPKKLSRYAIWNRYPIKIIIRCSTTCTNHTKSRW